MFFTDFDFTDEVLDALDAMRFETCTPIQEKTIQPLLDGRDLIGVAQTGTGKTAAYLLPVLNKLCSEKYSEDAINCVIMAPTRELAQQIDRQLEGFTYFMPISSVAVYGGNDGQRYNQELRGMSRGADIIVATPGRLISHINLGNIDLSQVSFFILDEADRMLDMGFYNDIMTIAKQLPKKRQTMLFSATMPQEIRNLANTLLNNPVHITLSLAKPADGIKQQSYICYEQQKTGIIKSLFANTKPERVILFTSRKNKVRDISSALRKCGYNVGEMHSDLSQSERDNIMFRFKSRQVDIIVATDILARGIDIDDIRLVINFDVPRDCDDYIHRVGRTARAGSEGRAITLVSVEDQIYFKKIEDFIEHEVEKLPIPEEMGEVPQYTPQDKNKKNKKQNNKKKYWNKGNKKTPIKKGNKASATGKKHPMHILILIFLSIICACNNNLSTTLDNIESYVMEYPDSAIVALKSIEHSQLRNKEEAMRYTLLQALANNKKSNTIIEEETMHDVASFFEKKQDKNRHFLSLYALGCINKNKGHAPKAMLQYTQAEQYIDKIDKPIYIAMLYSNIAQLYNEGYDFEKALKYLKMSHLHYRLAQNTVLEHKTLVMIAQVLIDMKQYSEAEHYLLNELQWGYEKGDKEICQNTIENLLMLYDRTDYLSKSNWLLSSEYFSICDTTLIVDRTLAYMYAVENDIKTSNRYMRRAWKKSESINDTLSNLMQMYDISKVSGNYDDALMILENIHYIHDTIMRSALQQPMVSAQRDFYQSQAELHSYKLSETRRIIIFAIIATVLLLCILALIARNHMAAKNAKIERYMELADEMSKSLHAKNIAYDDISNRLENHTAQIATMEQQVGTLFKKQFEMLDELSNTFYETHEIKKDKEAIYRQVRKNIESLMNDKKSVEQLENIVNSYRNNIIAKLRMEIPQLGENELRFLVFLYAGFSAKAISIFTQDTVGNVYTKKSRIKSLISRSNTESKQLFLDLMN